MSFADTPKALAILAHVRELRPELPVIVRTFDDTDVARLREAGAAEIVAEVVEGSLMLATQTMMQLGMPLNRVLRRLRDVRQERYQLMRGFFPGATDEEHADARAAAAAHHRGRRATPRASARRSGSLNLAGMDVQVTAVRRTGDARGEPRARDARARRATCWCCSARRRTSPRRRSGCCRAEKKTARRGGPFVLDAASRSERHADRVGVVDFVRRASRSSPAAAVPMAAPIGDGAHASRCGVAVVHLHVELLRELAEDARRADLVGARHAGDLRLAAVALLMPMRPPTAFFGRVGRRRRCPSGPRRGWRGARAARRGTTRRSPVVRVPVRR